MEDLITADGFMILHKWMTIEMQTDNWLASFASTLPLL